MLPNNQAVNQAFGFHEVKSKIVWNEQGKLNQLVEEIGSAFTRSKVKTKLEAMRRHMRL